MGIFDKILGKNKKQVEEKVKYINWLPLTSLTQLEEIKKNSATESIVIFKHSTRCGISKMVIKQFENLFDEELKNLKVYYLDLLNYREISDEIGYQFQVFHQSPQALIIKNGNAVAHASHYDITQLDLKYFSK